ncbi:MAG TPA: DedA family protein [Gemmatimonadaceae bacterium]|nr:DedA family protein [Gemmatimonadaceae bacterium]
MDHALQWLGELPPATLYATLALAAAIENIFPPFPADTVVAFGSFLAARGSATVYATFAATWAGNVTGAMVVYGLGRRYGTAPLHRYVLRHTGENAEARLRRLYDRYGLLALFLSRFIPGVRAVVPPFAGALRLRTWPVVLVIAAASALWYGCITWIAYHVGANWHLLLDTLRSVSLTTAIVAASVVVVGAIVVWLLRRGRASS